MSLGNDEHGGKAAQWLQKIWLNPRIALYTGELLLDAWRKKWNTDYIGLDDGSDTEEQKIAGQKGENEERKAVHPPYTGACMVLFEEAVQLLEFEIDDEVTEDEETPD